MKKTQLPLVPAQPKKRKGPSGAQKTLEQVHIEATLAIADALNEKDRIERFVLGGLLHTALTSKSLSFLATPADTWQSTLNTDNQNKCTWEALSDAFVNVPTTPVIAAHLATVQTMCNSDDWGESVLHCKVKLTYKQDRYKIQWWVDRKLEYVGAALCSILLSLDSNTQILRGPPPKSLVMRVMNSKVAALKAYGE